MRCQIFFFGTACRTTGTPRRILKKSQLVRPPELSRRTGTAERVSTARKKSNHSVGTCDGFSKPRTYIHTCI